eukprot:6185509-Pleurochrysis_carterae.AAC.3
MPATGCHGPSPATCIHTRTRTRLVARAHGLSRVATTLRSHWQSSVHEPLYRNLDSVAAPCAHAHAEQRRFPNLIDTCTRQAKPTAESVDEGANDADVALRADACTSSNEILPSQKPPTSL